MLIGAIESYGQYTIQGEVKAYDGKPLSDILVAAPGTLQTPHLPIIKGSFVSIFRKAQTISPHVAKSF